MFFKCRPDKPNEDVMVQMLQKKLYNPKKGKKN